MFFLPPPQISEDEGVQKALQGVQQGPRPLPVPRRLLSAFAWLAKFPGCVDHSGRNAAVWEESSVLSWGSKLRHYTNSPYPSNSPRILVSSPAGRRRRTKHPLHPRNSHREKDNILQIPVVNGDRGWVEKKVTSSECGGSRICRYITQITHRSGPGSHMAA